MKPDRPAFAGSRREELLQEREHVAELLVDVGVPVLNFPLHGEPILRLRSHPSPSALPAPCPVENLDGWPERPVIEFRHGAVFAKPIFHAMSDVISNFDFQGLSSPEKLELIGQLWDSIPESLDHLSLPESHRKELERRLDAADADPNTGVPWEQLRERLRQKP